jgi:hypothetical protein
VIYDRRAFLGVLDPDPDVVDLEDPEYLAAWLAHRHDLICGLSQHAREAEPTEDRPALDLVSTPAATTSER